ncbi:MAG: polysaccharide deacetylase family protein [bacterium]
MSKINSTTVNRLRFLYGSLSYLFGVERFGHLFAKRIFWRANTEEPVVALSFDDGPHPIFTPGVLNILDKHDIRATFFLIGRNVEARPELARQILDKGHEIGNHTYTHATLPRIEDHAVISEIRTTSDVIAHACGGLTTLLRPPRGLFSRRVINLIEANGHKTTIGDVYPRDTTLPGAPVIIQRVLRRVRAGSVIILHEGFSFENGDRTQTMESLKSIVPELKKRGFQFKTISELIEFDQNDGHNRTGPPE